MVSAVFVAVAYLSIMVNSPPPARSSHGDFAYHAHVRLTIKDLRTNTNLTIPGNIGVPGGIWVNRTLDSYGGTFAPLHTHDESGLIHIEPTVFRIFTLGDFFGIWGQPLSTTCVWYYCSTGQPGSGPPIMATKFNEWLEGLVDPGHRLQNGDEILILLGTS